MLLRYVGEDVFDLSESLGIVSDTPFEETERVLTDYFAPQRNVEYEVFVFRQAAQHTDETLDTFNARLRQLAKNCNFPKTDREVRSQIIQKCLLSKVREKGLSDTDIALAHLLKYGHTLEATLSQGLAMTGNTIGTRPKQAMTVGAEASVYKTELHQHSTAPKRTVSRNHNLPAGRGTWRPNYNNRGSRTGGGTWRTTTSNQARICSGCGGLAHDQRDQKCAAWGKRCHKCQRDNHFASVCRSKASRAVQHVTNTPAAPCFESSIAKGVQHVSYGEYEALNNIQINNVNTVDHYRCTLMIIGVSAGMDIDTGTAATIISSKQYELIKQGTHELQLSTANVPTLRTYAGKTIAPAGGVTVDVCHQESRHRLTCLVFNGTRPNLLGRDWLTHIKLDWSAVHRIEHAELRNKYFQRRVGEIEGH